jgi:hypothetical protein
MRHLITLGFFILALGLYILGAERSSGLFSGACFLVGAVFELVSAKRLRSRALPK